MREPALPARIIDTWQRRVLAALVTQRIMGDGFDLTADEAYVLLMPAPFARAQTKVLINRLVAAGDAEFSTHMASSVPSYIATQQGVARILGALS